MRTRYFNRQWPLTKGCLYDRTCLHQSTNDRSGGNLRNGVAMIATNWRNGVVIEGERMSACRGNGLSIVIDDYREDSTYIDPSQAAMLAEIEEETYLDLKDVARVALDNMPDVSCSAIASALGLKLHAVIALSNGTRNKAKRKGVNKDLEYSEVTREELIENYRAQWAQ